MIPETRSIIIYQEQIVRIAKELGNMSVEDAENVRIGMGKKQIKVLELLKPKFISGASLKISPSEAEQIWDMMFAFAGYGFAQGHSTAYVLISYACSFMKTLYPLCWWASILSNADSVEINEVLYKHIRHILTPPDINLSEESMIIDYEKGKIRSKLSILNGISDNLSGKIQAGRPYLDIKDFVKKKICGEVMLKKLTHIGVMDSIMPNVGLEDKIRLVNQAFIDVAYEEKIEKGIKPKKPKVGVCDTDYLFLSKLKDFQMKKAIYPTMNLDLDLIMKEETTGIVSSTHLSMGKKDFRIKTSEFLSEWDNKIMNDTTDFAVAGYVLDLDYFTYSNDTKKACKILIDSSGYISEKIIWPNKETGILTVPFGLEKGSLAWFCYTKRGKKIYTNIDKIYVEKLSIISKKKKVDKKAEEE
jgi:DNA polymerase-3 subunit alpha